MKFFRKVFVAWMIFGSMMTVSAQFSDVNDSDVNFEAINFLKDQGIISGYPDGSFRPDNVLNRAELTKIVVESSDVQISLSEDCFPDLERGSWYARYVCTAKELGVVAGYPDGTFKPAQNINRAEAVKIIAEAENLSLRDVDSYQDVESGQWYELYVDTAYDLNYLPYLNRFEPGELVLRRNFSEIYFRSIQSRDSEGREYVQSVDLGEPYYADLSAGNVLLTNKIPKYALVNEVYFFKGEVASWSAILSVDNSSDNSETFLGTSGDDFNVPLWFGSKGLYQVNISGEVFDIQVLEDFEVDGVKDLGAGEFYVSSYENDVVLNQVGVSDLLKKYEFEIGDQSIVFLNRQTDEELIIPNFWLNDLWNGEEEAGWRVYTADVDIEDRSRSSFLEVEGDVLPIVEGFEIIFNNIANESIDYTFGIGDSVDVSFEALIPADKYLYIIDRSGRVVIKDDEVNINGDKVSMNYRPPNSSLYEIIEINDVEGRALVNYPVYKRNVLPIADDPYDTTGISMEASIENALIILNNDRLEFGLEPLVLNDDLANLAQFHAVDMAENDYVSHADLSGRRVSERKNDFGIKSFVGENIARNSELAAAQSSLMRSAAHRVNILDPNWTEVGFGIAFDDVGSLYLVQNFSFDSDFAIDDIKNQIESRIGVEEDDDLEVLAEDWSSLMVDVQEYGTQIQGRVLMDEVGGLGRFVAGNAVTGISTFVSQIEELLEDSLERLENEGYDYYGFDVKLGDDGVLYFVLIVTS